MSFEEIAMGAAKESGKIIKEHFRESIQGKIDATITPLTDPKLEHPGGCLIVDEAGGKSTDFSGKRWDLESKNLIATNNKIHGTLLELINEQGIMEL